MTLLPIADRELREAARRRRTYGWRAAVALISMLLTLGVLTPSFGGFITPNESGRRLFEVLSVLAFVTALAAGIFITADAVSEEKREGTLGLLFLTNLRGYDVVLGKLVAKSLNTFYGLLTVSPVLALTILLGGVTLGEFWRMLVVLLNTLFFSLAAGMFFSVVSWDGRKSMLATLGMVFVVTGGPALAFLFAPLTMATLARSDFLLVSPALGYCLSFDQPFRMASGHYWLSVAWVHVLAWGFLITASRAVPLFQEEGSRRSGRSRRRSAEVDVLPKRRKFLELSPLIWLVRREAYRFEVFWGFLIWAGSMWLLGILIMPRLWLRPEVVAFISLVLHGVIKCWIAWEVTRRLSDARRNGELELLLVTPIRVGDIVQARVGSLKRQFLWPVFIVVVVDLVFLLFGSKMSSLGGEGTFSLANLIGIGLFVADSYTLCWIGLWQGISARHSTQAFLRTVILVLVLPWMVFILVAPFLSFVLGHIPAPGLLLGLYFVVCYCLDLFFCAWSMEQCFGKFRLAASEDLRKWGSMSAMRGEPIPAEESGDGLLESS